MIQTTRIIHLVLIACIAPPIAAANALQISIPTTVSENLPKVTERIILALSTTDLELEISYLPNKRSLTLLRQGKIALEFFRTPSVVSQYSNLIKLEPSVRSLKFKMITSSKTPENCNKSESEYQDMSIAGVLGIGLHQIHFYPKFKTHTTVGDVPSTAKFVALQRADVSFLPDQILDTVPKETMDELVACDNHFEIFAFHAHLHKDFSWAKENLENALYSEFGN